MTFTSESNIVKVTYISESNFNLTNDTNDTNNTTAFSSVKMDTTAVKVI